MYFNQVTIIRILHTILYNGNYADVSMFKRILLYIKLKKLHTDIL